MPATTSIKKSLFNKSIVNIQDLSKQQILEIIDLSQKIKNKPLNPNLLNGVLMGSCFFEPSTRTKLSFESAMKKLGGGTIGFSGEEGTSVNKGEDLYDTIRVVENYVDLIVLRHSKEGAARLASSISSKPVINAGDGAHQHPTQTLLDLFTIFETQKTIDTLNIGIIGDLKHGRAVHSLIQALGLFDVKIHCFSLDGLDISELYRSNESQKNQIVSYSFKDLSKFMTYLDILYVTRLQKERFEDIYEYNKIYETYKVDFSSLKNAKSNLKILHPLPRVAELPFAVDKTPFAYYFEQAKNGFYVRQVLLALIMGKIE